MNTLIRMTLIAGISLVSLSSAALAKDGVEIKPTASTTTETKVVATKKAGGHKAHCKTSCKKKCKTTK